MLGLGSGSGLLLGSAGHRLGGALRLARAAFRLDRGNQYGLGAIGETGHFIPNDIEPGSDGVSGPDLLGGDRRRGADAFRDCAHFEGDAVGRSADVVGAALGAFGKGTDLVGDDREAAALLAGTGGLDRGVEGEKIGLVGNLPDGAGDLGDVAGLGLELLGQSDGGDLAGGIELDRRNAGRDPRGILGDGALQDLAVALGLLGFSASSGKALVELGHGGERLLGGTGRFLGRAGDLLHRRAELVGGGGCLGDAARQLLGRGADALDRKPAALGPRRRTTRRRGRRDCGLILRPRLGLAPPACARGNLARLDQWHYSTSRRCGDSAPTPKRLRLRRISGWAPALPGKSASRPLRPVPEALRPRRPP